MKWSESHSVVSESLRPHGLYSPWNSPGHNTEVGKPFSSLGDLPNPGIETRYPTLQVDSLPAEPQGKPKNTGVGSLSLLQQIFPTHESNRGPCNAGGFFTNWAIREAPQFRGETMNCFFNTLFTSPNKWENIIVIKANRGGSFQKGTLRTFENLVLQGSKENISKIGHSKHLSSKKGWILVRTASFPLLWKGPISTFNSGWKQTASQSWQFENQQTHNH